MNDVLNVLFIKKIFEKKTNLKNYGKIVKVKKKKKLYTLYALINNIYISILVLLGTVKILKYYF